MMRPARDASCTPPVLARWRRLACVVLALSLGLLAACQPEQAAPQPSATTTVSAQPAPSATVDPQGLGCLPGETAEMIWPVIDGPTSVRSSAGATLSISASGGSVRCGPSGYHEGGRSFAVFLDQVKLGSILCYINHCEGEIRLPSDLSAGRHTLSVEGGSAIIVEI